LKIFRSTRQDQVKEKKFGSYLLYAIGEIILVMIGILLAMQVNNWNENRKKNDQLNSILSTVAIDLKTDTIRANLVVQFYDTIKKKTDLIIQRKLNRKNYQTCPECRSIASIYQPFIVQKKGYELLENFSDNNEMKNDTLVNTITRFYNSFGLLIDDSNVFIKEEVFKNIERFKQEDWFVEWSLGETTDKMVLFFYEGDEYRKIVAANDILAGKNHKSFVKRYKIEAKKLLQKLEERLE
jgi:hypothetical protein